MELFTSAKRDQPAYHKLKNYLLLNRLLQHGVNIYEFHDKLLHTKLYLSDGEYYNIGSFNNDRWSWKVNNELNLMIKDKEEAEKVNKYVEEIRNKSKPLREGKELSSTRIIKMYFWQTFLYLSERIMSKN